MMQQTRPDAGSNQAPEAGQVAAYVASLARELKTLANAQKLSALCYFIDLVRIEAEERARHEQEYKVA